MRIDLRVHSACAPLLPRPVMLPFRNGQAGNRSGWDVTAIAPRPIAAGARAAEDSSVGSC
jgi:hypothetical protein